MNIIKKMDIVLIALLLVFAFSLIFIFVQLEAGENAVVVVSIDGIEYMTMPLDGSEGEFFRITTERGENHILIESGAVRMIEADCPDQVCLHQGSINFSFQAIVCLPNRFVVSIRQNPIEEPIQLDGMVGTVSCCH